jgi:hypothetical protein
MMTKSVTEVLTTKDNMAKSFLSRYTDYLLEQVLAHKPAAADYIAITIDDIWQSSDCISSERHIPPPRYGIATSIQVNASIMCLVNHNLWDGLSALTGW